MRVLLYVVATLSAQAATIRVGTVCSPSCDYSNTQLQTALNAAVKGDIVELTAGEIFEGRWVLPRKTGAGEIVVRSSRWRELPPQGTRVTAAHAALMPKLQPPSTTDPALTTAEYEVDVSSVNTSTNVLSMGNTHGWTDGQPIACWAWNNSGATVTPSPLVMSQIYYVRAATATTLELANTPGGAAVDITTSTITASYFRCSLALAVDGWRFTGIEIRKKPGQETAYNLVEIGTSTQAHRNGLPNGVHFDRVYIHGINGESGPRICLFLNSRSFSMTDSRMEFCQKEGEEGKGIAGNQAPGPILIRNNYIAAGSINIIFGGDYVRTSGLVNGDGGGMLIEGNHFTRSLDTKFTPGTGGAGAPVGVCTDNTYYLNVSNGQWYYCTGTTWGTAATCAEGEYYRRTDVTQNCASGACWQCNASGAFASSTVNRGQNYYTKNLFEMKSVIGLRVRGNIFENNWSNADQSGVAVWIISQVDQYNSNGWVRGEDIVFEDNIIRNSTQGIRIATYAATPFPFAVRNKRIVVRNNLFYKIGATDFPSINYSNSKPASFSGYCDDCVFDHNTMSSETTGGAGVEFGPHQLDRFRFTNNVGYMNLYGMFGDGGTMAPYVQPGDIRNTILINNLNPVDPVGDFDSNGGVNAKKIPPATVVFVDKPSLNFRLAPTSPYSASCPSGCSFKATDDKDLGADSDMVESATGGAVSGLPWLGGSIQVIPGSTRAVVRYTAPSTSSCNLTLYNDIGRAVENGDTNTGGEKADTRAGNVTNGVYRQFVLGTTALTASTQYWGVITCGTSVGYFELRTVATGAGYDAVTSYGSARTGEYSSSADMSSPTAISSSATHTVPVPSAGVRYYRATGGAIRVFVAP